MSRWTRATAGLAGGLGGTLAGHWAVFAARAVSPSDDLWLLGRHGPPFFELSLSLACFFAILGAAAGSGTPARRLARGAAAAAAAFTALALPMAIATRLFSWGEGPQQETWSWVYLVFGSYAAANAAGASVIGALETRAARGAVAALAGAGAGWAADRGAQWLLSSPFDPRAPFGLLPPASAAISGALWGAGIGLALSFLREPPVPQEGLNR